MIPIIIMEDISVGSDDFYIVLGYEINGVKWILLEKVMDIR